MTMTITHPSQGTISIGKCLYGTEVSIIDYSRKERDEFGNITVIQRGYSDAVSFSVEIDTENASAVKAILAACRAISVEYTGDTGLDVTTVTGYLNQFSITIDNFKTSTLSLEVEGEVQAAG